MAVFTPVSFDDAAALVGRLRLGELTRLDGISSGIENTNYFADTTGGRYVLTLFERLGFEQLPFYLLLMKHLAERGIPVPAPQADADGQVVHALAGKPAAVVSRLRGRHRLAPDAADCGKVGAVLARMHLAGRDFPLQQANLRGLDWWTATAPQVLPFVAAPQAELLGTELAFQQQLGASPAYAALPRGPIHGDLFRDNVMFEGGAPDAAQPASPASPTVSGPDEAAAGEALTGLFDFYFAGTDTFAYDLAVCLNDWCIDLDSGRLAEDRAAALVAAYDAARPLSGVELRLLPALMRAAALRFWISRLWDLHLPRAASILVPHDPAHFERVLRCRVDAPWHPILERAAA